MKVQINNLKPGVFTRDEIEAALNAEKIFMEPQKRYAVIEVYKKELYIAVNVLNIDDEKIVVEYFDYFRWEIDIPMLMSFSVDWSCIDYGFCKLIQWAPEMYNQFGGTFSHTAKRFYFDVELYKKCYEEENGVPCKKKI